MWLPKKGKFTIGNLNTIYPGETALNDVTASVKQLEEPVNITVYVRRVWRYQRCNHNRKANKGRQHNDQTEKGQTTIYKSYT